MILGWQIWRLLVVTASDVAALRRSTDDLATLAIRDTNVYLGSITSLDPAGVRNALIETTPAIMSPYMVASSELTAAWYEQVRPNSGYALALTDVSNDELERLVRYSVGVLFDEIGTDLIGRLAGGLQKMIAGESRSTVYDNVDREQRGGRVRVGYARSPRSGCCAFCALLASRGAVYTSSRSAGNVVGRGMEPGVVTDRIGRSSVRGGGVQPRGAAALGTRFHNFCRCVVVPVEEYEPLPYDRDHYLSMYESVPLKGDVHEVLADMRSMHGLK